MAACAPIADQRDHARGRQWAGRAMIHGHTVSVHFALAARRNVASLMSRIL